MVFNIQQSERLQETYATPKGVDTGANADALEARARVIARISFMMVYYLLIKLSGEW